MQYTPNYNLITVEGTDVVNPLVQMNPNFTDIDAAMFANKQASIGTATEITVGTVHSITRANTDSNYFCFTATSNWTVGDSMSIDGVTVSVFLTDGTTPGTGAYVINSEVFGIIAGSRVTLYLANPDVNKIGDLATLNTADKSTIVAAINELYDDIADNTSDIQVVSDGTNTYSQILDSLFALIDSTKITKSSVLKKDATIYRISSIVAAGQYDFGCVTVRHINGIRLKSFGSEFEDFNMSTGTGSDVSNTVPSAGEVFGIVY